MVIASLIEFFIYRKSVTRNQNQPSGKQLSADMKSPCAMEDRWIIFRFVTAFIILRYAAPARLSLERLFIVELYARKYS